MTTSEHADSPLSLLMKHGERAIEIIQEIMPGAYISTDETNTGFDVFVQYTIPYFDVDDVYDMPEKFFVGNIKVLQEDLYGYEKEGTYEPLSDDQIIAEAKRVRDDFMHVFKQIFAVVSKWDGEEEVEEKEVTSDD